MCPSVHRGLSAERLWGARHAATWFGTAERTWGHHQGGGVVRVCAKSLFSAVCSLATVSSAYGFPDTGKTTAGISS